MVEVFKQTHTLKENKEQFADKQSSDIWASSVSLTSPASAGQEEAVDLREQPEARVHDADVEASKEQLREELQLMQEHRRQMAVTGKQMRAGASSAAQDPSLHPPALPEDDNADYVNP
ncbi:hypothetical protein PIB30_012953 [Stylosanthes scabra]|uniref:Uncharacterized protein n=1 Tax=Stylosanthes scabra TaxID=79078 RepID=A0ABU6Z3S7_9FABA|nr:hypothetical protein [Stylosanthes scabra]